MIIGLLGHIGSGKNTVARLLCNKYAFQQEAFANPVKDAAAGIFGWPRDLLEGDTEESREFRESKDEWWSEQLGKEITPRLALQVIGTESVRINFHPDIWAISLKRRIQNNPIISWVVSDTRFTNEVELLHSLGGFIIQVVRSGMPEWHLYAMECYKQHKEDYGDADTNHRQAVVREKMKRKYPSVHESEWSWAGIEPDFWVNNDRDEKELEMEVDRLYRRLCLIGVSRGNNVSNPGYRVDCSQIQAGVSSAEPQVESNNISPHTSQFEGANQPIC